MASNWSWMPNSPLQMAHLKSVQELAASRCVEGQKNELDWILWLACSPIRGHKIQKENPRKCDLCMVSFCWNCKNHSIPHSQFIHSKPSVVFERSGLSSVHLLSRHHLLCEPNTALSLAPVSHFTLEYLQHSNVCFDPQSVFVWIAQQYWCSYKRALHKSTAWHNQDEWNESWVLCHPPFET